VGQATAAALNNARRAALEKATGVEVRGTSTVYNFQLINDLVQTATRGIIVKEKVLTSKCSSENDQVSCSAKIEAWVKPLHAEKRGNFKITTADVHRPERQEEVKNPYSRTTTRSTSMPQRTRTPISASSAWTSSA